MPSLTLDHALIWFAHCPKAGGTSIETLMVRTWSDRVGHLGWGWDRWWHGGGWRTADPPSSPQHLVWEDAVATLPRAPDRVFAVVRDPFARIASERRWQRDGRRGPLAGRLLARLPFTLWLRIVLRVAARNPYAFDNHLRPQTDFIPDAAQVFRLEEGLGAVTAWLSQETGTPLGAPPHRLRADAPAPAAHARDRALVAHRFAADHARFGYPRPGASATARPAVDLLAALLAPAVLWLECRGAI